MLALVDDERLAALAAGGSERAFGELVQRHEARLLMVSRSVLHSDDDARDAVQNALLKAFRGLQAGQLRGAPRPWLARIAHNEARSLARVRREFAPLDPETLGASGDPHEVMLAKERLATLVADVAALPDRLRRPLLLRAEAGLSYDAIALELDTTASIARQAVCDARAALEADASAREADCADIRTILTGPDRRRHRSRRVRGHLRACVACRAWRPERRPFLLLPAGSAFWNVAQWLNTLFTAGSGSVAGAARSTALVVAVSAGSVTLAADRPERVVAKAEEPRRAEPRPTGGAADTRALRDPRPAGETRPGGETRAGGETRPGGDTRPGGGTRAGDETRPGGGPRAAREPRLGGDPRAGGEIRPRGGSRPGGETWARGETRVGGAETQAATETRPTREARAAGDTRLGGDPRVGGETRLGGDPRVGGGTWAARDTRAGGEARSGGGTWAARDTRAGGEPRTTEAPSAGETQAAGETGAAGETRTAEAPAAGETPTAGETRTTEAPAAGETPTEVPGASADALAPNEAP